MNIPQFVQVIDSYLSLYLFFLNYIDLLYGETDFNSISASQ